jgi:hypothetical protein
MRVFISWAKEPSRTVAQSLRDWLPDVVQSIEPWMSSTDVGAGARWGAEVAEALSAARIGIVCTTPQNQREPWLLFEAGALAKTVEETFVCPYLIQMRPADLEPGPLTQFQAKVADRDGTYDLLATVNRALGSDALPADRLRRLFDRSWPDLEAKLAALPPAAPVVRRPQDEMMSEVLDTVRSLARRIPERPASRTPEEQARSQRRVNEAIIRSRMRRISNKVGDGVLFERLKQMSDAEVTALYNYLKGRAKERPVAVELFLVEAGIDISAQSGPTGSSTPVVAAVVGNEIGESPV